MTSSTFQGGRGDHPCHTHTLDPPLGPILGLQAKKGGGPTLGPMLKSLHRGPKGGVRTPWTPPPGSATAYRPYHIGFMHDLHASLRTLYCMGENAKKHAKKLVHKTQYGSIIVHMTALVRQPWVSVDIPIGCVIDLLGTSLPIIISSVSPYYTTIRNSC